MIRWQYSGIRSNCQEKQSEIMRCRFSFLIDVPDAPHEINICLLFVFAIVKTGWIAYYTMKDLLIGLT